MDNHTPTKREMYAAKKKAGDVVLDELLVFEDLWVTVHVWAKLPHGVSEEGSVLWLDFRLIEHEAQGDRPRYPTEEFCRPSRDGGTEDARVAVDFGEGYIKWDGCSQVEIDRHCCGVREFFQISTAMMRLFAWAAEELDFENCDPDDFFPRLPGMGKEEGR